MFKTLSLVLLGMFTLQSTSAQTAAKSDTLKYYFDADDIETSKEFADHSILILPKSEKDGGLYPVVGYYTNGQMSFTAFLKTQNLDNQFEGKTITYYTNGNKKRVATFHNGEIAGEATDYFENGKPRRVIFLDKNDEGQRQSNVTEYFPNGGLKRIYNFNTVTNEGKSTEYFPNGNIYAIKNLNSSFSGSYIECRDSIGTILAKKGNGKIVVYSNDFKIALRQATIKNGETIYKWDPIVDSTAVKRFDQTGPIETDVVYKPFFSMGLSTSRHAYHQIRYNFIDYVNANFTYPEKELKNKINNEVDLSMVVEKDGALTHIKVNQAASKALTDEVVRVIQLSSPWQPGRLVQGTPARSAINISFKFTFKPKWADIKFPDATISVDENSEAVVDSIYNKSDTAFLLGNIDKQPEYYGGLRGLAKTVEHNIGYPEEDRKNQVKGKVYVQFVIEKDGNVSNVHALSGPSNTLKEEAERVTKLLTQWQPGAINNKPVRTLYTLPISFSPLISDTVEHRVDKMPEFPGGVNNFGEFLVHNIWYPKAERENGVSGGVRVSFVVETDGTLSNFKVLSSPSKGLSNEALRVLKMSPKWSPALLDGKRVRFTYTVPVNFTLETVSNREPRHISRMTFMDGLNN